MAITFIQQKKRQRFMILILIGVFLLAIIFLWQIVWKSKSASVPLAPSAEISRMTKKIEINLDIFQNPAFQALGAFEELSLPKEKIGRDNPFMPY